MLKPEELQILTLATHIQRAMMKLVSTNIKYLSILQCHGKKLMISVKER